MLPALLFGIQTAVAVPATDRAVLLDSVCDPAEYGRAAAIDAGSGVTLHAMHDRDFLYFCLSLPPKSLGALDLYLRPGPAEPITNLHVSAQVGERTYREGEDPPWQWRNHRGWFGTVVPFSGVVSEGGQPRGDFDYSKGRELQLSKSRFTGRQWELRVQLYDVAGTKDGTLSFPADPNRWLDIRLK